ncbi:MAG: hypothetical protein K1X86_15605 [Ignavibacteria bacterium]|nr:hypothetical protein [Ignavibacteria bacterium]
MSKNYKKLMEPKEPSKHTFFIMGWNKKLYIEFLKGKKFEFVNISEKEKPHRIYLNSYQKKTMTA